MSHCSPNLGINKQHQGGAAAIWFALVLVPVLGAAYLAVEGTRYIQETSRLRDGAQAAAAAVTVDDKEINAGAMAQLYIHDYVRGEDSAEVTATRVYTPFEDNNGVITQESIQYDVQARTRHTSWLSSEVIPSFRASETLGGEAIAKKYPFDLGDKNIDIVFVSDFSGSMSWRWGGTGYSDPCTEDDCKITDLQLAVNLISDRLLCRSVITNDEGVPACEDEDQADVTSKLSNRVAVVPFNIRTRETNDDGNAFGVTQLRYRRDVESSASNVAYAGVHWSFWRSSTSAVVYECHLDSDDCPTSEDIGKNRAHREAKRLVAIFNITEGQNSRYFPEQAPYVDYSRSVNAMFTNKFPSARTAYQISDNTLYSGYGSSQDAQFFSIPLTSTRADISQIDSMWAAGSTAAFQGMLRGFQYMEAGRPDTQDEEELEKYRDKVKMVLVLSDGVESPDNGILKGLVDAGMCNRAREVIPNLYIAVIGIDFAASEQSGFQDCVLNQDEDIVDVNDTDDFIENIIELIQKGTRGMGVTRLYGE